MRLRATCATKGGVRARGDADDLDHAAGRGDAPPPRLRSRKGHPAALRSTRGRAASQRAGAANGVVPKRITVDPATGAERTNPPEPSKDGHVDAAVRHDGGAEPSSCGQMQTALLRPPDGGLVVPTNEEFSVMRAEAKAAGKLKDLRKLAAAWQAVAEKCDLAFEELFRLAVFRLEVERDLGMQLAQTIRRGGDRTNYPRGSLLPDGVTWKQSAGYQNLAAIPEDVFRAYVERSRGAERTPSSRGARAFAGARSAKTHRAPRPKKAPASDVVLSPKLIEACVRCLGDIDVMVGKAIVALPRDIDAAWWSSLSTGPWSLCVPNEPGSPIIAHIGGHARGFTLVFAPLGVVAEVLHRLGDGARE